jgi:hypothetical protein
MGAQVERGIMVLADISGSTAFVTATELEHGPSIIAELLEEVMRRLSPPLEIQELEGDAVFALGPEFRLVPRDRLLDVLDDAFVAFRRRQREMQAAETCCCQACQSAPDLDLKIVAHYGPFVRQVVGGRSQVAGADVILAHRLLKNRLVSRRAYLLLTEAAVRWIGIDPARAGLAAHRERYEHLGDVRCFVRDLEVPAGEPGRGTGGGDAAAGPDGSVEPTAMEPAMGPAPWLGAA